MANDAVMLRKGHQIAPPSPRVNRAHPFARGMTHCWFPRADVAVDVVGGEHIAANTAHAVTSSRWGPVMQPGAGARYETSLQKVLDIPASDNWTLSTLFFSTTGAAENNAAIVGWEGTDDLIVYPADAAGTTARGRIFWRDAGDADLTNLATNISTDTLIWQTFSAGPQGASTPWEHSQTHITGSNSGGVSQDSESGTTDTTGVGPFSTFTLGGWTFSQFATQCRILCWVIHNRRVSAREMLTMAGRPVWEWLQPVRTYVPGVAAAPGGNPVGPLGHPLHGPFAGALA